MLVEFSVHIYARSYPFFFIRPLRTANVPPQILNDCNSAPAFQNKKIALNRTSHKPVM